MVLWSYTASGYFSLATRTWIKPHHSSFHKTLQMGKHDNQGKPLKTPSKIFETPFTWRSHILAPLVDHVRQPLAPRAPRAPRAGKASLAPAPRTPWSAPPRPRPATWRGASAVCDAWLQPEPHARLRRGPQIFPSFQRKEGSGLNLQSMNAWGNHENIYIYKHTILHTRFRDSKAKEIQSPNFCKPGGNHFRASNNYGITWWENIAHYLDVLLGILVAWCIAPLCHIHAHMTHMYTYTYVYTYGK